MLDVLIWVNTTAIGRLRIHNVKPGPVSDYEVSCSHRDEAGTKHEYRGEVNGFKRSRGALELISAAIASLRKLEGEDG